MCSRIKNPANYAIVKQKIIADQSKKDENPKDLPPEEGIVIQEGKKSEGPKNIADEGGYQGNWQANHEPHRQNSPRCFDCACFVPERFLIGAGHLFTACRAALM